MRFAKNSVFLSKDEFPGKNSFLLLHFFSHALYYWNGDNKKT